ncbi:unnamed protein product [Clonostachys rosea f. rosea IK726]|uniref:Uncharacterized protein n=1 Tax=Clonostachys rosea f. rosea IK726 TaxID=1349383 RepID=A0ACA9U262_BIOOC|nr:unnamed protein product [Clonostachys rosea f. rosea IK726]
MSYHEFERSVESIKSTIDNYWYVYQETRDTLANMDSMESDAPLRTVERMRRLCIEGCRLQQFLLEEFEKTYDHGSDTRSFWYEISYYCAESVSHDFAMDNDDEVESLRDSVQQRLETLRMGKGAILDSLNTVYPTPKKRLLLPRSSLTTEFFAVNFRSGGH